MTLPDRLFFTGVPGSHWSGIAQDLYQLNGINQSDYSDRRKYEPGTYTGHQGAYFGREMEFAADIEKYPKETLNQFLDSPWTDSDGTKILKSHDWAYRLDFIKSTFPTDWIMLVYRPTLASYSWWHEAGGFNISYPSYTAYKNSETMMAEIMMQNKAIMDFACKHNATWKHFSLQWIKEEFGQNLDQIKTNFSDILVTVIR